MALHDEKTHSYFGQELKRVCSFHFVLFEEGNSYEANEGIPAWE